MKKEDEIKFHVVNTLTQKWYHVDQWNRLWTCSCTDELEKQISLCITIDESLARKGELRDLDRKIAEKRKELGLKPGEPFRLK